MAWTNWISRSALTNVTQAASSLQLCARLLADAEAVIRAIYEIFKDHTTECILLIDAENAFNSINRNVMLYNLKYICPVMSTYIFICYTCPVRLFIIGGCKLLSNEGKLKRIQHPISVGRLLSRHITAAAISAQFCFRQRTQL